TAVSSLYISKLYSRNSIFSEMETLAPGRFLPSWQSLSGYETPEWFRNAKFGIWAHWGPQCAQIPNLALRNHSGVSYPDSDCQLGRKRPGASVSISENMLFRLYSFEIYKDETAV